MIFVFDKEGKETTFHIGTDPRELPIGHPIMLVADGHELEYIRSNFDNLPIPNHKRVVKWYGELASFILKNW